MMDILLDSGAFSAWKLGERIDLDNMLALRRSTSATSIDPSIST